MRRAGGGVARPGTLEPGEVLLLENLRFHAGEETNDPEFAKDLARSRTSMWTTLSARRTAPTLGRRRPEVSGERGGTPAREGGPGAVAAPRSGAAVRGDPRGRQDLRKDRHAAGALRRADILLLGGGMANHFVRAIGLSVGRSLLEEDKVAGGARDPRLLQGGGKDDRAALGLRRREIVRTTARARERSASEDPGRPRWRWTSARRRSSSSSACSSRPRRSSGTGRWASSRSLRSTGARGRSRCSSPNAAAVTVVGGGESVAAVTRRASPTGSRTCRRAEERRWSSCRRGLPGIEALEVTVPLLAARRPLPAHSRLTLTTSHEALHRQLEDDITQVEARAYAGISLDGSATASRARELVLAPAFTALEAARRPPADGGRSRPERGGPCRGRVHGRGLGAMIAERAAGTPSSATRSGAGSSARRAAPRAEARAVPRGGADPIYCVGETARGARRGTDRGDLVPTGRGAGRGPGGSAARRGLRAGLGDRHGPRGHPRGRGPARVHLRRSLARGATCGYSTAVRSRPTTPGALSSRRSTDSSSAGASLVAGGLRAIARA